MSNLPPHKDIRFLYGDKNERPTAPQYVMPYLNPDLPKDQQGKPQVQYYDTISGKIVVQDKDEFEMQQRRNFLGYQKVDPLAKLEKDLNDLRIQG